MAVNASNGVIMEKVYYLIPFEEIEYKMLSYSRWCMDMDLYKSEPPFFDLLNYQNTLRIVEDDVTKYYIIPFTYNFSTPMRGFKFYSTCDMREELKDPKYKHNQEEA